MTIASAPLSGQDGGDLASDLGQEEMDLFLQRGMDRKLGDLPVGRKSAEVRRSSNRYGVTRVCILRKQDETLEALC